MRYKAGDVFPQLTVITSKGTRITIPVAGANYTHIQFRRFSGCPICNTHIAEFRRSIAQLKAAGIHEVLFFHSSQEDVAAFHKDLPFDAVGDREKHYYSRFGVESSWKFANAAAVRAALASILRGNFGLKISGGPLGLPAEFLVAADGRIKAAHYGKHAYDQWAIKTLLDLARDSRSVVSDAAKAINGSAK